VDFFKVLHAEREGLGLSVKVFMKALRYALTGMKVGLFLSFVFFCFLNVYAVHQDGPSMAAIMKVIGRETTLERLT
jgi:glutamyl-tRNA synthetase